MHGPLTIYLAKSLIVTRAIRTYSHWDIVNSDFPPDIADRIQLRARTASSEIAASNHHHSDCLIDDDMDIE